MGEKDKIKQFLENQGISKNKFYAVTGLSQGFLDSGKSLGADKVKIIIKAFPELSIKWLILDEGNMIVSKDEASIQSTSDVSRLIDIISSQQSTIDRQSRILESYISQKDAQTDGPAECADAAGA